ncbi:MAG: ABC transporter permease [Polyangiaceae bacterium]
MLRIILTSVSLALRAIWQWRLRASLTIFGILVGIAAVVMTIAIGEATEISVQAKLKDIGENIFGIQPDRIRTIRSTQGTTAARVTENDGHAIQRESPNVVAVAPLLWSQAQVAYAGLKMESQVTGTTRSFFDIRHWPLTAGELWSEQSELTAARVCLIGANIAGELFGAQDPVGQVLRVDRYPFVISGVLAKRSHGAFGGDLDTVVLVPVATKRAKLQPTAPGSVQRLLVKARSANVIEAAMADASDVLRQRHRIREGEADDFSMNSDDGLRQMQEGIVGTLRTLLTSIAAVSLLVGGIGIMNIMLVSVSERTRDIGIRMAIGATRWHILTQFLIESVTLCLIGGILGVLASVAGTAGLGYALSMPVQPSGDALLIALVVSSAIGVVFGLVPSWRAASLDPIVALGRQ